MNRPLAKQASVHGLLILALLVAFSSCSGSDSSSIGPQGNNNDYQYNPDTSLPADSALAACIRTTAALNGVRLDSVGLASLYALTARGRGIASLEGIGVLRNLRTLDLSENQITDLSPLASLESLRELDLSGNRVTDLTPLASLPLLETVLLQYNLIRDPSPLLHLTHLATVELKDNPLEATAQTTLAALTAQGVAVTTDEPPVTEIGQSPPGTYTLAFQCGPSSIYLTPYPKGESTLLYAGLCSNPRWAPDGMSLAFTAIGSDKLSHAYVVPRAGGGPILTTRPPARSNDGLPCWSPSGDRLAFFRIEPDTVGGSIYRENVYTLTVATGEEQRVTTYGDVDQLLWGPTEGTLTIKQDLTFSLLDLRNGTKSVIAQAARPPGFQGMAEIRAWSADGTRLLLTGVFEGATDGIYVCQPPAPPVLVVANTDSVYNSFSALSPDGTRIVFSRSILISGKGSKSKCRGELVVYDFATRTEQILHSAQDRGFPWLQWSPDGALIAFCFKPLGSTYTALFVTSLVDNTMIQLTDESTPSVSDIGWSPR